MRAKRSAVSVCRAVGGRRVEAGLGDLKGRFWPSRRPSNADLGRARGARAGPPLPLGVRRGCPPAPGAAPMPSERLPERARRALTELPREASVSAPERLIGATKFKSSLPQVPSQPHIAVPPQCLVQAVYKTVR